MLFCINASGQRKLLIGKFGKPAKYIFDEGETIRIRLTSEKHWNKAIIQHIGKDYITLHNTRIALDEIAAVDIRNSGKNRFLKTLASISAIGGLGFAAIDQLNRTLIRNEPGIDKKSLAISGTFLIAGGIFLLLKKKQVRIKAPYTIRTQEF